MGTIGDHGLDHVLNPELPILRLDELDRPPQREQNPTS
jgi:hypothetical protein